MVCSFAFLQQFKSMHKFCIFIIVLRCFNNKRRDNFNECIFCVAGITEIPTVPWSICVADAWTCFFEHARTLTLVDVSDATSEKSSMLFITILLAKAAVWTSLFKVPPIPSTAPLPWPVVKKFQLKDFADKVISQRVNLCLNWKAAPSEKNT